MITLNELIFLFNHVKCKVSFIQHKVVRTSMYNLNIPNYEIGKLNNKLCEKCNASFIVLAK